MGSDGVNCCVMVSPRGVLEPFMPLLMPEYGHSDELLGDEDGLLDQATAVLCHVL